jgi:hypothetical protein
LEPADAEPLDVILDAESTRATEWVVFMGSPLFLFFGEVGPLVQGFAVPFRFS